MSSTPIADFEGGLTHIPDDEDILLIEDSSGQAKTATVGSLVVKEELLQQFVENFNKSAEKPYKLRIVRNYPSKYWFENGRM